MTVPATTRRAGPFTGNGVTTSFPFTFKVFANTDLRVDVTDTSDVTTTKVLTADYTVTLNPDQDATPGGTVVYAAPLPLNYTLVIIGNLPYDQTLDLPGGGNFSPVALENALDRGNMQIQQLAEQVNRAFLLPATSDADGTLPTPEANKLIGWDSLGEALVNRDASDLATLVAFGTARTNTFAGTGAQTAFTLSDNPSALANLRVSVDGLVLTPTTDYNWVSGTTLTFTTAPANGAEILVQYLQGLPQGTSDSASALFVQAGIGAITRIAQDKMREVFSVKDFGAVGDGVADDTAAINAADAAACAGALGLDGATVVAENCIYFPPGTYKTTASLTYRGAPWRGAGIGNTFIKPTISSGACINATGATGARKLLSISDMTLLGNNATGTAHGIRVGFNQRSFGALQRIRVDHFPGPGIYFAADTWSMSFYDVYVSFCGANSLKTGIYVDAAATSLLALDWHNLQLENNGAIGSGVAGGMELPTSGVLNWNFYGGVWEGNYGDAEARFTSCEGIHLYGVYTETDVGSCPDGLIFASCVASVYDMHTNTGGGATGKAIRCTGTAKVSIGSVRSDNAWPTDLSVEGTSIVTLLAEGLNLGTITVASGAQLRRLGTKRVQLTDAATIAVDASLGNSFFVTLGGNRTMGTPTNPSVGQQIWYTITQDATGGRTLAFSGTYNATWSDAGNLATRRTMIGFEYDGTFWNQLAPQSPYI